MIHDEQMTFEDISDEYRAFVDKFKRKKTTDDCYTPPNIYEAVRDWACARYGIDPATIVRPFFPELDYRTFDYPAGCFVLDNPPFSLMREILEFYKRHGIRFFLFASGLVTFNYLRLANVVCTGSKLVFENGADICIGFVTSEGEWMVETAPDLHKTLDEINERNRKEKTKKTRKYAMPDCIATSARLNWLAVHGERFRIRREDALFLRELDCGVNLYGGGLLLSERAAAERAAAERAAAERAAAERAAAERAAAERAVLSERELEMQRRLG